MNLKGDYFAVADCWNDITKMKCDAIVNCRQRYARFIIVVFDKDGFRVSKKLVRDIAEYIDEHYVETHYSENRSRGLSRLLRQPETLSNANRIFEFS